MLAGPFVCQCPSSSPCPVSTPRSSNWTCGFAASSSPTGISSRPTDSTEKDGSFTSVDSSFRDLRTEDGVGRPCGQSPGSWSLPQRTRSEVPSLHRHYPASTVLRTSPPPSKARPVPRGSPVASHALPPPRASRVAHLPLRRHAVATTQAGPLVGSSCSPVTSDIGLPRRPAGSAPALAVSRPARRSLTLRPACLRSRLTRPFTPKASAVSLPPLPLRLLLAGATVARWD